VQDVDDGDFAICSLAVDSSGIFHLLYDTGISNIHSGLWDGATWDLDFVPLADTWLGQLVIDRGDASHLVYSGPVGSESIRYAVDTGAGWDEEVVVDLVAEPYAAVLAVGPHREPHVAYHDNTLGDSRYAHCR